MSALAGLGDEAQRIFAASDQAKITLKLLGGVAISFRCPSSKREGLKRKYLDLDFIGHEKQSHGIKKLFVDLGYEPRERFNAMHGAKRLIFNDMTNYRRVDIFLDVFEMCHKFDFRKRADLEPHTLPLADLLATKLQIVHINEKDFRDMVSLFLDHEIGDDDGDLINGPYLADLCSNDWGIYKTFTMNLAKFREVAKDFGLDEAQMARVNAQALKLAGLIEAKPKSMRWKMRARVGEGMQWYDLPEADKPVVAETGSQPDVKM